MPTSTKLQDDAEDAPNLSATLGAAPSGAGAALAPAQTLIDEGLDLQGEATQATRSPLLPDPTDRNANPPPSPATQTDIQVPLPRSQDSHDGSDGRATLTGESPRREPTLGEGLSGYGEEVTAADYRPGSGQPTAPATTDVATAAKKLPGQVDYKDPYVGTMVAERYRILGKIGEGGMGTVYLAEHAVIERKVALKILSQDFARKADLVQRFIQEARAAARIGHKNIVEVTDFGETASGSVFFAMEYLEGQDLSQLIRSAAPLPAARVRRIATQICQALAAAHGKKIIHRDLKPENIFLLDREGQQDFVKVLDFGIAKITSLEETAASAQSGRLTRTGMIFGTPEYMSPEQARGDAPDHRVDIYAVGCIIYEMLTGTVPFSAESFMGTLTKHMLEPVEPPSRRARVQVAPDLEMICLRALEKDRDRRFQTMTELVAALDGEASMLYSQPVPLQDPSRVMGYTPGLGVPVAYSQMGGVPSAMQGSQISGAVATAMAGQMSGQMAGQMGAMQPMNAMGQAPVSMYVQLQPHTAQVVSPHRPTDATTESQLPPISHESARRAWFVIIGVAAGLFVGGYLLLSRQQPTPDDDHGSVATPGQPGGSRPLQQNGTANPGRGEVATLVLTGTRDALVIDADGSYLGKLPLQQPYRLKPGAKGQAIYKFTVRKDGKEQVVELPLEAGRTTERNIDLFPHRRDDGKPEPRTDSKPETKPETKPVKVTGTGLKDPF